LRLPQAQKNICCARCSCRRDVPDDGCVRDLRCRPVKLCFGPLIAVGCQASATSLPGSWSFPRSVPHADVRVGCLNVWNAVRRKPPTAETTRSPQLPSRRGHRRSASQTYKGVNLIKLLYWHSTRKWCRQPKCSGE
jgi:hypothetical protein